MVLKTDEGILYEVNDDTVEESNDESEAELWIVGQSDFPIFLRGLD